MLVLLMIELDDDSWPATVRTCHRPGPVGTAAKGWVMVAEVSVLVSGRGLVEAPRWHQGRLYFSDWSAGEVIAVDSAGQTEVVARVQSLPLCSAWLPDGRLLIVSSADGLLLRREPDGSLVTHAELGGPGWNDIVVDGRGNAYVNAIGFDMTAGEQPRPGHVAVATADGTVRRVAEDLAFPNGMAVTADNATLIVAESYGRRLTAFDIGGDSGLSGRRVFADLGDDAPDGICLDAEGAVWYATVPGRRCVRVVDGGRVLQAIGFDRGCFACVLGGPDGRTLFVTAAEWRPDLPELVPAGSGQVCAVRVSVPGAGWP
jgi:sugar lactone lactonase YvrE